MKRQRLVVISDKEGPPEELSIEAAFGSVEAYKEWMAQPLAADDAVDAVDFHGSVEPNPEMPSLKMMMVLMERPFFALTNRRIKPIAYRSLDGSIAVSVMAGADGMATIYDADIVMFLIDQLAMMPAGNEQTVVMKAGDFFRAVGSKAGGDQYHLLDRALHRLATTRVTTNAMPSGKPGPDVSFCWVAAAERMGRNWHIKVPAWLAEGARSQYLLSISPSYFELRGLSRALYLVARKHVGSQDGPFRIRTSTLHAKLGSASSLARFRHEIKKFTAEDALPDFALAWEDGPDGMVTMKRRV